MLEGVRWWPSASRERIRLRCDPRRAQNSVGGGTIEGIWGVLDQATGFRLILAALLLLLWEMLLPDFCEDVGDVMVQGVFPQLTLHLPRQLANILFSNRSPEHDLANMDQPHAKTNEAVTKDASERRIA